MSAYTSPFGARCLGESVAPPGTPPAGPQAHVRQSTLTWYRADGDRLEGNRLRLESQHAHEAAGLVALGADAAGNIPLAAIPWDAVDVLERVVRVIP
jgi:hypothetical protein